MTQRFSATDSRAQNPFKKLKTGRVLARRRSRDDQGGIRPKNQTHRPKCPFTASCCEKSGLGFSSKTRFQFLPLQPYNQTSWFRICFINLYKPAFSFWD